MGNKVCLSPKYETHKSDNSFRKGAPIRPTSNAHAQIGFKDMKEKGVILYFHVEKAKDDTALIIRTRDAQNCKLNNRPV